MHCEQLFEINYPQPICVGTGFLALDVLMNGNPHAISRMWAGGSCGNVLAILAYLGWETYPIAKLGEDEAAKTLLNDLNLWNVKTGLISKDQSKTTPIIIEKLKTRRHGVPQHQFKFSCPNCQTKFPRYRAVPLDTINHMEEAIPQAQVFYFDRVRRSTIELAKINRDRGALIFFEPSGIRNEKLFIECLQLADIVKYSSDRLEQIEQITCQTYIPIEIETLSSQGLRYRLGGNNNLQRAWKIMPAFTVNQLVDAAGSGDWCSAGIIHVLGRKGREGFEGCDSEMIEFALKFGQALAALNCYYEGARGGMYTLSRSRFQTLIKDIISENSPITPVQDYNSMETQQAIEYICPNCTNRNLVKE